MAGLDGISNMIPRQDADAAEQDIVVNKDPAPAVNASIWAMMAVSTAFLAARAYCKVIRRGMWWDDYIMILGWAFLLASTAVVTELMRLDFGMTAGFVPHMHTLSMIADVTNKCALGLTKTSFGATLLRVSDGSRLRRWTIWFLIVTMNAVLATNAVTTWRAACEREGLDEYEAVLPGSCWSVRDAVMIAMVANGYSAIVDFVLAFMSWSIVWKLQMKRIEKIGVAIAMSLGMVAGVVGVLKVVKAVTIAQGPDIPYTDCRSDRLSILFIWGWAEPNATIVATSIPVLRVLVRDIHRSRNGTYGTYGSYGTYGTYGTAGTGTGRGPGGGSGGGGYRGSGVAGAYLKSNGDSRFPQTPGIRSAVPDGGDLKETDDDSDRGILGFDDAVARGYKKGPGPDGGNGGIVRTTEVAIDYDRMSMSRGGRNGGGGAGAGTRGDLEEGFELIQGPRTARVRGTDAFGRPW